MKVQEPGHAYLLDQIGTDDKWPLLFLKRSGDLVKHDVEHQGTICQEVMRALIDRLKYLDYLIPCPETQSALTHMRHALYDMEKRAFRRKQQKVNRRDLPHESNGKPPPWIVGLIENYAVGEDLHIDLSTW